MALRRAVAPAVTAFLLLVCGAHADPIRYGVSPHADSALAVIGGDDHKGWYKEEGLDVEFTRLPWHDVPEAIATGKLDVAIGGLAQMVSKHEKYPDLVFWYGLATLDNGFALMIRPNAGLKTVDQLTQTLKDRKLAVIAAAQQLKGKSVVVSADSELGLALASVSREAGLHLTRDKSSDIGIIDLRADPGLQVFLAHQGDAYMGPLLQRLQADKAGMVEMLSGSDFGAAPIVGMLTTRTYAAHHQAELEKLLKVWFRTVNYVQLHPGEGAAVVVEEIRKGKSGSLTAADFERVWQNFEHYPLSPAEAAADIIDPDGPHYWKTRQQECSAYFCSVADTSPEQDDSDKNFLMPEAQAAYVAKYGSGGQ